MTLGLFVAAAVVAVGDWIAVTRHRLRIEYVLKPLTLLLLVLAASSADLGPGQTWIVTGLIFGLLGDVGLMLSRPGHAGVDTPFLVGLGAFLLGHVCYLVGFLRHGVHPPFLLAGLLVVSGAAGLALPRILGVVRSAPDRLLLPAVGGYAAVLGVMTISAIGTGAMLTAIGGLLFLGSDTVLAIDRFVAPLARGPVVVIVSYHLAQALIVLGLLR